MGKNKLYLNKGNHVGFKDITGNAGVEGVYNIGTTDTNYLADV